MWVLCDPTRRDFFDQKGKRLKNLVFLGEIFQTNPLVKHSNPFFGA